MALFRKVRSVARDKKGAVGLMFALAALPAFALMGGIVDYVNIQNERHKLQAALDAGTLAAMRLRNLTANAAKQKIKQYLQTNYHPASGVQVDFDQINVDVSTDSNGVRQVTASLNVNVRTTFWGLLGISNANMRVTSQTRAGTGSLEVVLVLDNTGSMGETIPGDSTTKIEALRESAKQLVDILKNASSGSYANSVKVGLVPFTTYVRLETSYWNSPWLTGCKNPRNGGPGNCTEWWVTQSDWEGYIGVRDISTGYDIIDDGYSNYPVPAVARRVRAYHRNGTPYFSEKEVGKMQPLVSLDDDSQVRALKNKIDDMGADGWTYIPVGLVWGWRLLSNRAPFTEGAPSSDRNVKKVIVLMTDGANTCRYDNEYYLQCNPDYVDTSVTDDRLRQLCENVKQAGIDIISIAFAVTDTNIRNLMNQCQNMGYYEPSNAGDLASVFNQIANQLTQLHLSR